MKKKLQNSVNSVDLKSVIHENSLFFDKLIELIPPRFYLPVDDTDKKWFQGLSKDEKASLKKESRENVRKSRRDRLDPEKSSASTLDKLMKNLEKEKTNDESVEEEEVEINPMKSGLDGHDHSATYEELRKKYHQRIEELRGGRGSGISDSRRKRNEKREIHQKKRKRETLSEEKKPTSNSSVEKLEKDVAEATKELKFGHVKLGNEEDPAKKKMKKHSKLKELEKAKELKEAKKNPEKGDVISWQAAKDRAKGVKVHDDPKLLKLSLKKEKKMRQKNAEKWKERIESQQKMKAEKQQKRSQNIADRIHQKKARQIAKREKKLMRPGFEGRKEGYINPPSTANASS